METNHSQAQKWYQVNILICIYYLHSLNTEADFGQCNNPGMTRIKSVHTIPEGSPRQIEARPSISKGRASSCGKDLALLMKSGIRYQTPTESLYFREGT